jgi:hypothetical protein
MKLLHKVREELEEARAALQEMKKAHDLASCEKAWKLFLIHLERVWLKLDSHLCKSPKYKNWLVIDHTKHLRKHDPLLSYLTTARGADEHTIEEIVERQPGMCSINPVAGDELYIESITNQNDNVFIKTKQPISIVLFPPKLNLKSITNRNGTYNPPETHIGNAMKNIEPIDVAEAGLKFYENLIIKAEEYFLR